MNPTEATIRMLTKARPEGGARPGTHGPRERSLELYRETGDNFRSVCVEIRGEHFQMDTHDMGRATEEFWGDSDYEFWAVVQRAEWPKLIAAFAREVEADDWATEPATWSALSPAAQGELLLELAKARFEGDSRGTDRLRDLCDKHDVECSGGSWV